MDRESPFPFHYGQEAEQYSYYRVPNMGGIPRVSVFVWQKSYRK